MIRREQIDRAVAEYFRRRRAGEQVSPEAFAATAPQLAPELLEQLSHVLQGEAGGISSETGRSETALIEKQLQQQSTIILGPLAAEENDPIARPGRPICRYAARMPRRDLARSRCTMGSN